MRERQSGRSQRSDRLSALSFIMPEEKDAEKRIEDAKA
jgi:hypothetical protein